MATNLADLRERAKEKARARLEEIRAEKALAAERQANLADRTWRLANLYYIVDTNMQKVRFKPNWAQEEFHEKTDGKHGRHLALKARQLGFSTYIRILCLDTVLWEPNTQAGLIADTLDNAKALLLNKDRYAFHSMDEWVQPYLPKIVKENETELRFDNGSFIVAGTSLRSGTYSFLHISEYGKICARFPLKAAEIRSGALNTAPPNGRVYIESTAEGASGDFYDKCQAALIRPPDAMLSPLQYAIHFYPWYREPRYEIPPDSTVISSDDRRYFATLEKEHGIVLSDSQKAWYVDKAEEQQDEMKREFPSCIAGDVLVSTKQGWERISHIRPDGVYIKAHFSQGVKDTWLVTTKMGYQVKSTSDHLFLCADDEFRYLYDLAAGSKIQLDAVRTWPKKPISVSYNPMPFVDAKMEITPDFALFLGIYMGDGSFTGSCLSIACDRQDQDVVDKVVDLMAKFSGGDPYIRHVGSRKGCSEVRIARTSFVEPFRELNLIRQRNKGCYQRNIHVPEYIKKSPKEQVACFLRGLFEADGFAQRNGTGVKLFSKYDHFLRDIQLLLLRFGITARLAAHDKKSGDGGVYTGWELCLRTEEARIFVEQIGFLSERKRSRIIRPIKAPHACKRCKLDMQDEIVSIVPAGPCEVYDITTSTSQFSAGGVVVHNCEAEAFEGASQGNYYGKHMLAADREGRLTDIRPHPDRPVFTFWDLGLNDMMVIWFMQFGENERRQFFDCYANTGYGLSHYVGILKDKKADYGFNFYGAHVLPHDGGKRNMGPNTDPTTTADDLSGLGLQDIVVMPRGDLLVGINKVRQILPMCYFDKAGCKDGVRALRSYRRTFNEGTKAWGSHPLHDWSSDFADAFRTQIGFEPSIYERPADTSGYGYGRNESDYSSDGSWMV